MPDLLEHMYCAQQINIPPNLPYILKQYAKAAIRTQPYDLLYWSAAYFRAKANNSPPPVKERLEYPPFDSPSRLSPGFLRVLHKQLGKHEYVRVEILYEKWLGVCLVKEALDSMLKIGNISSRVPWLKFVAIAAGHICTSLSKTMVLICEVLTDQPDGGAAWVPVDKFVDLYEFLARLNCGPEPPLPKRVEIDIPTPSLTSTQATSSVADGKEPETEGVEGKDSTAGLMVWPDIKPEAKKDKIRSPKFTEEAGATSELGVEVYDEGKGTVTGTELVTLYPAPTKAEGQRTVTISTGSPTRIGAKLNTVEIEGESTLSHSSLKENEDWIKVEAKNMDAGRENEALDLDKLVSESPSKIAARQTVKEKPEEEEDKVGKEPEESPEEHQDDEEETKDDVSKEMSEKEIKLESEETASHDASSAENMLEDGATSQTVTEAQETAGDGSQPNKDSEESENVLTQAITMMNFVEKREVGYSVVEIRKGRVGDQSVDHIETDGPVASPTVHRLISVKSDESSESKDSVSSVWDHVPGIGPMVPDAQILAVVEYMQYWASKQQGMVGPRNINHLLCPPLDLPQTPPEEESMY